MAPHVEAAPAEWAAARRFGIAFALYASALTLRWAALPLDAGFVYASFYPATVAAFLLCGHRAGWACAVSSGLTGYLFFPAPATAPAYQGVIALAVFAGATLLVDRLVWWRESLLRQLRLAEKHLRSVLDRQTELVLRIGPDRAVLYANQACGLFFGLPLQAIAGCSWSALIDARDIPMVESAWRRLAAGTADAVVESRIRAQDGKTFWYQFVCHASFAEDGTLVEILVVGRDVTERRDLERRLADKLQEAEDLYDNAPCGYCSLAQDGTILRINTTALAWLGCSRADTVGRLKPSDFLDAEGRDLFARWFEELKAMRTVGSAEFDLTGRDGMRRRVGMTATLQRDEYGALRMSHAVMHDVTEMADARERLADLVHTQQSRLDDAGKRLRVEAARLRCIFESVSDAILAVDDRRTVVLANAAADSMFGCTGGALVGLSLDRMLCDCDLLWQRARAAEPGAGFGHEMHGRRTDGSVFPLSAAMARAEVDGQFLFTAVFRDLTEYVCAERSLHAGRALLDAALASMQDAVVIADSDGRLVEFNDAFVSFHRFGNRSDCMTRLVDYPLLFEVSDADGRPVPQEAWPLRRALRGEVASQIEYRVRRIDTNAQWVGSYSFSPVRGAGGASGGAVLSMRDVTLWHGTQAELHTSQRLLRQLLKVQDDVAQEERKRIARDIHDDLLQQLAAIRLEVGIWEQSSDPQDCVRTVDRMVSQTIAATRRIVNDLRPQALEEFGLVAAMQALTGSFARRSSVQVELDVDPGVEPLLAAAPAISTCIFRVAQEALHNVEKHAIARQVSVRLSSLEQGRVGLSVMDDGQGVDARGVHRADAFGLLGIHERVRSLGGDLHIRSRSGAGFCLTIDLPARDVAPVAWSEPGNPIRPVAIVTIDRAG